MPKIDRRHLLKAIGAASGGALVAGCIGDDDDDDDEPAGERVPTLSLHYYQWDGTNEATAPHLQSNVEDIGFDVEVRQIEGATFLDEVMGDQREQHMGIFGATPGPDRLDPQEFVTTFAANNAGPTGGNYANYADCEYTHMAHEQTAIMDRDERQQVVNETQEHFGEDFVLWMLWAGFNAGVARSDMVDVGGVGDAGIDIQNFNVLLKSETDLDALTIGMSTDMTDSLDFLAASGASRQVQLWNVPNSCLFSYDEHFELQNILAETREWVDETTFEVTLRDGTFHNGEPITAEDVKFTYEHVDEYPGHYEVQEDQGFESIDVIDEQTIVFNFEQPNAAFDSRYATLIPIVHKETFVEMGVDEDPDNFDMTADDFVGSGPFQITHHEPGQVITLEPFEDHPYWDPPDHRVHWEYYADAEPRVTAFENGDVQMIWTISAGFVRQLEESLSDDELEVAIVEDFGPKFVVPQHTRHPTQFLECREAISHAMDRELYVEVALEGEGTALEYGTMFPEVHPWRPDDEYLVPQADDLTGDPDRSQEILEDAGWEQDSDGDWHYPEDKDLSPPWPEGEDPTDEQFDCLDSDGNYAG